MHDEGKHQRHREWLAGLKPGDEVVRDQYNYEFKRVASITKTQVVLEDGERFRREDGRAVTRPQGRFAARRAEIREPTTSIRDHVERTALVRELNHHRWDNTSLETLRAVKVVLDADKTKPTT